MGTLTRTKERSWGVVIGPDIDVATFKSVWEERRLLSRFNYRYRFTRWLGKSIQTRHDHVGTKKKTTFLLFLSVNEHHFYCLIGSSLYSVQHSFIAWWFDYLICQFNLTWLKQEICVCSCDTICWHDIMWWFLTSLHLRASWYSRRSDHNTQINHILDCMLGLWNGWELGSSYLHYLSTHQYQATE